MIKFYFIAVLFAFTVSNCRKKEEKRDNSTTYLYDSHRTNTDALDRESLKNLSKAISKKETTKNFTLFGSSFNEIPDSVFLLTNLEYLWILHNKNIDSISPGICALKELVSLDLFNNSISYIGTLGCLKKLNDLRLGNNLLETLPNDLSELDGLEILSLSNNNFHKGLNVSLPVNLKEIYLDNCKLKTFPKEVLSLTNIEKIDLSFNAIDKLPDELVNLTNLRYMIIEETLIPSDRVEELESLMSWCEFVK